MAFLRGIEAQYLARVPVEQGRNPAFRLPLFRPPLLQRKPGALHELLAFHRHLKSLPRSFSGKFGCDPHCNDDPNSCPPCDGWGKAQYEEYLAALQAKLKAE